MIPQVKTQHHAIRALAWLPQAAGLLCCGLPLVSQPLARAAEGTLVTAVSSRVGDGYVRARLDNGSFEPETYAFGEGGLWGGPTRDDTIDKLHFVDVARTVAVPLAAQNYLPAKDPKQTKLLIMVYWGATAGAGGASSSVAHQNLSSASQHLSNLQSPVMAAPPYAGIMEAPNTRFGPDVTRDPLIALVAKQSAESEFASAMAAVALENRQRDKDDWQNARILGYDSELAATAGPEFTVQHKRQQDLIEEIEEDRYFVVLMAYDFQMMWKEKKHRLLWETRLSIRQRHHDFANQLAAMVENASRYFGQDSRGLVREPLPEGRVTLGEVKVLGVVP
jgi:hypothetical protein